MTRRRTHPSAHHVRRRSGIDDAKNELVEIVDFSRTRANMPRLGGTVPKACCWSGRQVRQKTLLARAVAARREVPSSAWSASEFVDDRRRWREAECATCSQAREASRSIIFVDELDAIGRARSWFPPASAQTQTRTDALIRS